MATGNGNKENRSEGRLHEKQWNAIRDARDDKARGREEKTDERQKKEKGNKTEEET